MDIMKGCFGKMKNFMFAYEYFYFYFYFTLKNKVKAIRAAII